MSNDNQPNITRPRVHNNKIINKFLTQLYVWALCYAVITKTHEKFPLSMQLTTKQFNVNIRTAVTAGECLCFAKIEKVTENKQVIRWRQERRLSFLNGALPGSATSQVFQESDQVLISQ